MTIVGNGQVKPTPQQNQPPRRMSLAAVHKPRSSEAWRGMLYSPEGLGKTTFGASAPNALFIAPESGFPRGLAPDLLPQPREWNDLYDPIRELIEVPHEYKTLVFDTMDWLQPLLFAYICQKYKADSIENADGGYGRGYERAVSELLRLLGALETLRQRRNMNIMFLAHAEIATFKNPAGADYDKWEPKLQKKLSAKIREWCDWVLFGNFEVATVSAGKKKTAEKELLNKGKAVNSNDGVRMLYTSLQPLYYAKNRFGMPEKLPFAYAEVARYLDNEEEALVERCGSLRRQINAALAQINWPEEKKSKSQAWSDGECSPGKLQTGLNRLLAEIERQQEEADAAAAAAESAQRALPEQGIPQPATDSTPEHVSADEEDTDPLNEDPLGVNDPLDRNDNSHNDPAMFEGEGWGGSPPLDPLAELPQPKTETTIATPPAASKPVQEPPQGPDEALEALTRRIFACKTPAEVEEVRSIMQARRNSGEFTISKIQGKKIRESFDSKLKTLAAAADQQPAQ